MTRKRSQGAKPMTAPDSNAASAVHTPLRAETAANIAHDLKILMERSTNPKQAKVKYPLLQGPKGSTFGPGPHSRFFVVNSGQPTELTNAKLAFIPNKRAVNVADLTCFAQNPLEEKIIRQLHQVKPGLLLRYKNPISALCFLRTVFIPVFCATYIKQAVKRSATKPFYLGGFAAYVRGLERALAECRVRTRHRTGKSPKTIHSSQGIFQTFTNSPEGGLFWMLRFDQWRSHAEKSWQYYISKRSIDVRKLRGELKWAAVLGVLKNEDSLPEELFAEAVRSINERSASKRIFKKNADPARHDLKLKNETLNTWLIEIWPVVTEYRWNSRDLRRVAHKRFEDNIDEKSEISIPDRLKELKDYCGNLGLYFAKEVRDQRGRPTKTPVGATLPFMGALAYGIRSLVGSDLEWNWIIG
jgi:hypothetical protein